MDPRGFTRAEMQAFVNTPEGAQLIRGIITPMTQQFEGRIMQIQKEFADRTYGEEVSGMPIAAPTLLVDGFTLSSVSDAV